MKLLIVDDEKEIVDDLDTVLREAYSDEEIFSTHIPRNAEEILNTDVIDILLTDIKMPGLNGFELAQIAQKCNELCHVIFLTGYHDFEYAYQAIKLGCDNFILKTNTQAELLYSVDEVVKKVRSAKQKQEPWHLTQHTEVLENRKSLGCEVEFVKRYIWENIDKHISLNQLAAMVYLNPTYLSRVFKNNTGQTIVEYITFVRIEKSSQLLRETNLKVQEIAVAIGIDSAIYFGRVYKKETGMTPQEYRSCFFGYSGN